eukprot:TRINITY_DN6957_c0_g1_i2.p1 TRINITY_DN6957_c0_g1~~TRINITY_DN6957_c0_g1_i2.p1  ORF type:complete len:390 (+),score=66.88 TRINITY_DN6957_c0_g1_i2:59-1171(+)
MADVAVIFDYDWSLIGTNSDTYIFEQLRPELLELLDGICEARGWTAAMDELLGRLAETGCSRAELEACVASVPFNVTLGEAVRALVGTAGIEMFVLSDANTAAVAATSVGTPRRIADVSACVCARGLIRVGHTRARYVRRTCARALPSTACLAARGGRSTLASYTSATAAATSAVMRRERGAGVEHVVGEPDPDHPLVKCVTTRGQFVIQLDRHRAPNGVARFLELVYDGFFRNNAFFRVVEGFVAQFGLNGKVVENRRWDATILDDESPDPSSQDIDYPEFKRGTVSFAGNGPNSRTTQIFITLEDAPQLGSRPWETPIGHVISGMDVVRSLYSGYGEGVDQSAIWEEGDGYLMTKFPNLDYLQDCEKL